MKSVSVSHLLSLLERFRDYTYGLDRVSYPWPIPNVPVTLESDPKRLPPHKTNCCTFAEALLVEAFKPGWDRALHSAFMVLTPDRFGPVHAAIETGMGRPLPDGAEEGDWRLVQGWRSGGRGHTFIVAKTASDGRVLILEANRAYRVFGVGYRDIGSLRDLAPRELPAWEASTWTWERLRKTYSAGMRACALYVE